jgi:hypothetical protein
MPFNMTTTAPLIDAPVTIKFAGLMLIKPAPSGCEIGIHRLSDTHAFQAIVVVNEPGLPPRLIRLLTGPLTEPFKIDVEPDPGTGVQAFAPPTTGGFDRSSPSNELDFRWGLNMREWHAGADFNGGASPIATLNAGTLYTSKLTRDALRPALVRRTRRTQLHRFAADLAVAINLPTPRDKVRLSWTDESGEPQSFKLPRPRRLDPPGTRYTVVLLNDPPISSAASHDELDHYYEVLEVGGTPIPDRDRFHISYNGAPTTDEVPCMPILLYP